MWLIVGLVAIVLCGSRAANGMLGIREDDNESNGGYLFDGACTGELRRVGGLDPAHIPFLQSSCYESSLSNGRKYTLVNPLVPPVACPTDTRLHSNQQSAEHDG